MWTSSKSKIAKEVLQFRGLGIPKRNTLIKSRSLGSISTLGSSFNLVPFSLPSIIILPRMANTTPNIYPTWENGVLLALATLHDILGSVFKTL